MSSLLPTIKFAFIGDTNTGKSSIGILLSNNSRVQRHIPTSGVQVFTKVFSDPSLVKGSNKIILYEVGGSEKLKTNKKYFFEGIDVICYFFNHSNTISLSNLISKWLPQINSSKEWILKHEPRKVLVGIRPENDLKENIINSEKEKLAEENLSCYKTVTISDLDYLIINKIFLDISIEYFEYKKEKFKVPDDYADIF